MSDKPLDKLNELDKMLQRAIPTGPAVEGVQLTIELRCGFEMFNTRPYHNYETWGRGYYIRDAWGVEAHAEDLDDAVRLYCERRKALDATDDIKDWERGMKPPKTATLSPSEAQR